MNIQNLYRKNKRLIFSIIIFSVFLLIVAFIKPGSAAALGRTDTGSKCYTQTSIASKGIMANGNPFVSIQYGVIGDQYARSFDLFGQFREPGSHIQSDQCTPLGWTSAWWPGGKLIDPSSAGYETALNGIAGTAGYTVSKVYLGIPSNQSGNAGYNAGSTGDQYSGLGVNDGLCFGSNPCASAGAYGRPFYGITNCLGATCNNNADVYGIVNDGGLAQINGVDAWCVGYNPGDGFCRGDVSSVYGGGGDFAGYLVNQNFSSTVGGNPTAGNQNYNPLNNLNNINKDLNTGNTYRSDVQNNTPIENGNGAFNLVQFGVNTRDRLDSGLSWDSSTCLNYAPYDGSCSIGKCSTSNASACVPGGYPSESAGDQSEDAATVITYELQAPPEVFTCGSSSINPNPVIMNSNERFTVNVSASTPAPATGTATVSVTYPDGSIHTYSIPSVSGTSLSGISSVFSLSSVGSYSYSWSFSPNPIPGYVITNNAVNCPGTTFTVVSAPYFNVTGGDVVAGSNINTSTGNCFNPTSTAGIIGFNDTVNGAGTTMAALALGQIYGFGTNKADTNFPYDSLAFANSTDIASNPEIRAPTGYFGDAPCSPSVTPPATLSATAPAAAFTPNPGNDNGYSIPITIDGLTMGKGKQSIIYSTGDIYIKSNVLYTNSGWASLSEIPSLKIVSDGGNIYIDPSVDTLYGTYMAIQNGGTGGKIYDCSTPALNGAYPTGPSDYAQCYNHTLTINGSFIAHDIYFERTQGNAYTPGGPAAEQFNYGPEDWLSSPSSTAGKVNSIQTLPPVF